ncbi:unnamed protein product [Linum trigynum]
MHFRKPGRWVDLQGLNMEARAIEATDTVEDPASPIAGKLVTPPPPHKTTTVAAATKRDLMEELTLAPVPLLIGERVNSTATKPSMSKLRAAVDVEKARERRATPAADSWRNRTTAEEDGVSKPSPPLVELRDAPPAVVNAERSSFELLQANLKYRKKPLEGGDRQTITENGRSVCGCIGPRMGGLVGGLLYGVASEGFGSFASRSDQKGRDVPESLGVRMRGSPSRVGHVRKPARSEVCRRVLEEEVREGLRLVTNLRRQEEAIPGWRKPKCGASYDGDELGSELRMWGELPSHALLVQRQKYIHGGIVYVMQGRMGLEGEIRSLVLANTGVEFVEVTHLMKSLGAVEIEIVRLPGRTWKFRKRGRYQ